jgi:hypothetical protein
MGRDKGDPGWEQATWAGARRAQIRRALALTVRERLQALEALVETSERLARLSHGFRVSAGERNELEP